MQMMEWWNDGNDGNDEMMLMMLMMRMMGMMGMMEWCNDAMMQMMGMMDRYFFKRLRVVIMLEVSILIISSASVYKLLNSSSEIYSVAFNSSNQ